MIKIKENKNNSVLIRIISANPWLVSISFSEISHD